MKAPSARVAMLLSIGGVLVAGSAAALVNSQVLDDQSSGAPASATAVSTTVLAAVTTTSAPTTTQAPTTVATVPATTASTPTTQSTVAPTSSAPVTVPATTAPAGGTQATYRLGEAGTALLDTAGGRLTIVSVTPVPGWSVERAESDGASVEIRLESESGEVRFDASLVRGVVRVSLDTDYDDSGSGGGDSGGNSGPAVVDGDNSGPGGGGDDDNSGPGSGDD